MYKDGVGGSKWWGDEICTEWNVQEWVSESRWWQDEIC